MLSPKSSDILRTMKRKNTEQAPTPETDAAAFDAFDGQGGDEVVFANLARRFERERNQARKIIEEFGSFLDHWTLNYNRKPEDIYGVWDKIRAKYKY